MKKIFYTCLAVVFLITSIWFYYETIHEHYDVFQYESVEIRQYEDRIEIIRHSKQTVIRPEQNEREEEKSTSSMDLMAGKMINP